MGLIARGLGRLLMIGMIAASTGPAQAGDRIHIVSSSTLAPLLSMVAEHFGRQSGFPAPVVESLGSGGGLKLFCSSAEEASPDIAGASRRITDLEIKSCESAGITDITQIGIGYDGIVIANAKSRQNFGLTKRALFLAIAKTVPIHGRLVANPYRRWSDIDPTLPHQEIMVYGPAPNHGTRDVLAARLMSEVCQTFPEVAALDAKARRMACEAMREDGPFIEVTADYSVTMQKLYAEPDAIGLLPFSYLARNRDMIQAASLDGKLPTYDSIYDGSYPLSRPLFVYVKTMHKGITRGLKEFLGELTSDRASGRDGYLSEMGLISLPDDQRKVEAAKAKTLPNL